MVDDGEKDLKDNRFSYLLQPIRDLAANWDINIAGELEEYLEELVALTFTIEGSAPALNFAEAALLIQGTTCVFSKKVEYLHNLVYQALETIFNKKQQEKQTTNREKAGRRGAAVDDGLDDAEAFFNLASQLEIAADSDINLDNDDETAPPELVRPPTALLALEDAASGQGGQQGNPGEVGSYRLAQCSVHISGALLLESKDGELFDQHLRVLRGGAAGATQQGILGDVLAGLRAFSQPAASAVAGTTVEATQDAAAEALMQQQLLDDDMGHDGYCDDGDDFAAAATDMHAMDAGDAAGAATVGLAAAGGADLDIAEQQQQQQQQHEQLQQIEEDGSLDWLSQPAADDMQQAATAEASAADEPAGRVRQQRTRGKQATNNAVGDRDYYDPYVPLDPAEPGPLPIKPLQVRKPKRRVITPASASTTINNIVCLNSSQQPQLHWAEFGYLLDKIAAAAAAARKKGKTQLQQQQMELPPGLQRSVPEVVPVMDWQDAAAAEQREQEALMADDADAGEFGSAGYEGYEDDYSQNNLLGDATALDDTGEDTAGGLRSWATGALGVHDRMGGGGAGGGTDGEMTYEELCRSHIESLIAAAAAQQVQSELAVRVSGWRARIDPILAAEEDRSAFDIHDYGSKILDRLVETTDVGNSVRNQQELGDQQQQELQPAKSEAIDFKQVAAARDSFEVCRLFAAMLQLVNNRNVNLIQQTYCEDHDIEDHRIVDSDTGQTCSNLQLRLLTVARVHEAMAEGLGGAAADTGLQSHTGQLEAPPPLRKAGGKKGKKAAQDGCSSDDDRAAAKSKARKAAARGKGSSQSRKGAKQKTAGDGSSDGEDGTISDHTSSESDAAEDRAAAPEGPSAGRRGKDKVATGGGGGCDGSDGEADAHVEKMVPAAGANKSAKQGGRPPAKRARRVAVGALA